MIWGQVGVLAYLKELGFETFENLFDESYDTIENNDDRLNIIAGNLNNLRKQLYNTKHKNLSIYQYDKITEEKIEHNYRLFFNGSVVESRLVNDLIHPFLEMCE
jgi:hypothetical protein